jgi:parvulin-like peptidyl-prolyl isomerase
MAKKSRKQVTGVTKKQAALSHRDQKARRQIAIGLIILSVLLITILGAGIIMQFVVEPSSPVATVNGERIATSSYQKMVRYQRDNITRYLENLESQKLQYDASDSNNAFMVSYLDQLISQMQTELSNIGPSTLDQMIDDILIRQGAEGEGVIVTDAEVQREIENLFGYQQNTPTPAPTPTTAEGETPVPPTPTVAPMTKDQFDQRYAQYLESVKTSAGFSEEDYRNLVRNNLYRTKLQEALAARVPTTGEQVQARHILVKDEETAATVLERLNAGEDFAKLAEEFSTDESNKAQGGELGWFGRGAMVKEFEDAAFSLPVGQISEPISTTFGYHIIEVEGHEQNRMLDSSALSRLQSQAFTDWLSTKQGSSDIQRSWTPAKVPPEPTPVA